MKNRIRYGVVGMGHIAQTAVLPAFKWRPEGKRLRQAAKLRAEIRFNLYEEIHLSARRPRIVSSLRAKGNNRD